jgi:hypothetical protein
MNIDRLPFDVVQAQLDAYNARDLDAFCSVFADNAEIYELGIKTPATSGKSAIRARYSELFARSPELLSVVVNRTAFGRAVIDHERITGRNGSAEVFEFLAIYEVELGLIVRVHFVRA